MLIGSDLKDRAAARREVDNWIAQHRCRVPDDARHLSVFENGVLVREWVLVERHPDPLTPAPRPLPYRRSDIILLHPNAAA
jgi:hypothetical protein